MESICKYEEDDSDVDDGECNHCPPLKKRKIISHDNQFQRHSISRRSVNDDEYQSYLKNHITLT